MGFILNFRLRVVWLAAFIWAASAAALKEGGSHIHRDRSGVPVLVPTIHAIVLEAPLKTAADADVEQYTGIIDKIGQALSQLLGHSNEAINGTASAGLGGAGNTTSGNGTDVASGQIPADADRSEVATKASQGSRARGGERKSGMRAGSGGTTRGGVSARLGGEAGLKTTSSDVVTVRMRLTSFIESISASLETMHKALVRFPWTGPKSKPYEIVSRNHSMLIVAVPGKRFFSSEGKHRVKPVRAVFHKHRLTVEIEESSFSENMAKNSSRVSEETAGIGTEYHFPIQKARVDVEEIYLRATNGDIPGYEIVVPLQAEVAGEEGDAETVSRTVVKATGGGDVKVGGHWGTNREEDEYEFLKAQLGCQKKFGTSGIGKLLCTCETVHDDSVTRRLLCVSRVADKIVRVAKLGGEGRIAARVYRGSIRCRNADFGISGSYECLVKLLRRDAGGGSRLNGRLGRSILSKRGVGSEAGARKVDEMVGRIRVKAREFLEFTEGESENEGAGMERAGLSVVHMVTFMVYVVGIGLLVVCFIDVGLQYRRHVGGSRADGRVSRLPGQAQALYARLVLRND
eukprot:GFKZ01010809.1.p1 GENE.GFKZ01010809.1~~GFKZ01010809.1.p1  ORF type:complete len:573 (+),score=69.65 GFKZ01010809.1:2165-3883(+)